MIFSRFCRCSLAFYAFLTKWRMRWKFLAGGILQGKITVFKRYKNRRCLLFDEPLQNPANITVTTLLGAHSWYLLPFWYLSNGCYSLQKVVVALQSGTHIEKSSQTEGIDVNPRAYWLSYVAKKYYFVWREVFLQLSGFKAKKKYLELTTLITSTQFSLISFQEQNNINKR